MILFELLIFTCKKITKTSRCLLGYINILYNILIIWLIINQPHFPSGLHCFSQVPQSPMMSRRSTVPRYSSLMMSPAPVNYVLVFWFSKWYPGLLLCLSQFSIFFSILTNLTMNSWFIVLCFRALDLPMSVVTGLDLLSVCAHMRVAFYFCCSTIWED